MELAQPMENSKNAHFYVAPDGDDSQPGTVSAPFATLGRARDAVRTLKTQTSEPLNVLIRGGTYYLNEPLVFTPEDSGTAEAPVTYAAYPGEKPTLSGGRRIVGRWQPFRDGIMMCHLPNLDFTQLFVNGRRQIRARYPNFDPQDGVDQGYINPKGANEWPHHELHVDPDTFTRKRWANPQAAILHIFAQNYWGNMQWRVRDVDWERHIVKLGEGGWQLNEVYQRNAATGIGERSRFYVENVFEELDAPGEWYLDTEAEVLYYMLPDGVDMSEADVEVASLKGVLEFRGSKENPVHHINLSGVRVAHTTTTFLEPYETPSLGDWAIHRGGAIFLEGAEDCNIEGCFFDAVGGNAVFINRHNRRIRVSGNTFTEAGESAVCLVGASHLRTDRSYECPFCQAQHGWSWENNPDEFPAECTISNNLIHDIGVFGKQTAGVFLSLSMRNRIDHNHIYNTPRAAICINDGLWGGHLLKANDIHDTVRETGDHGPFNSWGRERFWCHQQSHGPAQHEAGDVKAEAIYTTIIRNNRFRDYHGWGIDLDDGSSNYHLYNNLCIGISVKLREGDYRTVENNIFVNPANPPSFHIGYIDNSDQFRYNIIVINSWYDNPEVDINFKPGEGRGAIYHLIRPPNRGRWIQATDNNCFINDKGRFIARVDDREYNLDEWRELGYDAHSVFADPMFVDPANGDFRVKPESPALLLGFENFAMDQFGLTADFPSKWQATTTR
jgi:hypothetical protein